MKKLISGLLALVTSLSVMGFAACGNNENGENTTPTKIALDLRSPDSYDMKVGAKYKIVYAVKGSEQGVTFASSNDSVVTVDEYGNVNAVGVGEAVVTIALKEDSSITETMTFRVTKSFFYEKTGYKAGEFDLTYEDEGTVTITGGNTQMLVSECSEEWYFKCNITYSRVLGNADTYYLNDDSRGRFGIGSFLVNDETPIGEVMAWFGFIPRNHTKHTYVPYIGGWRVQSGSMDEDVYLKGDNTGTMDLNKGATLELIRKGVRHYYTVTANGETIKYAYDCPIFDGVATYPGVFSQNQLLTVTDYEATTDESIIEQKLNNFQTAESISINGVGDKLYAGETVEFTTTVLPSMTYNKTVTYALAESVEGVSLTADGVLTVDGNASGNVTVIATSQSDSTVTAQKTYTIVKSAVSASQILNTGRIYSTADGVTDVAENSFRTTGGENYVPLNAKGTKWSVSFTLSTSATAGSVGLLSATNGYMKTGNLLFRLTSGSARKMSYGLQGDTAKTTAYATDGASTSDMKVTVTRDGTDYYVVIGNRLIKKIALGISEETIPVLYVEEAAAILSNVTLVTTESAVDGITAAYEYAVGGYVTANADGSYTLAQKNFSGVSDINWPPVNGFENGIQSTTTYRGDFSVSFMLNEVKPISQNGAYDSKLLVYLRSESKTASLQFVIKGTESAPVVTFCPNLNDATWTEYDMPAGIDLLNGSNKITVVKKGTLVEVYVNDVRIFEDNSGLSGSAYWTGSTPFTPGIGTYLCGATISNVAFREV